MKKIAALLLVALMALLLCSCDSGASTSSKDDAYQEGYSAGEYDGFDEGYAMGYDEASEKYGDVLREAAEHVHKLARMLEESELYTIDDFYEEAEKADSILSDFW